MAGSQYSGGARKFVTVNATADSTQTIIAAVGSNQKIVVVGYSLVVSGTGTGLTTIQDTAGSPAVLARFDHPTTNVAVPVTYAGNDDAPAFELAAGTGLVVNNATNIDVYGHISYVVVS